MSSPTSSDRRTCGLRSAPKSGWRPVTPSYWPATVSSTTCTSKRSSPRSGKGRWSNRLPHWWIAPRAACGIGKRGSRRSLTTSRLWHSAAGRGRPTVHVPESTINDKPSAWGDLHSIRPEFPAWLGLEHLNGRPGCRCWQHPPGSKSKARCGGDLNQVDVKRMTVLQAMPICIFGLTQSQVVRFGSSNRDRSSQHSTRRISDKSIVFPGVQMGRECESSRGLCEPGRCSHNGSRLGGQSPTPGVRRPHSEDRFLQRAL